MNDTKPLIGHCLGAAADADVRGTDRQAGRLADTKECQMISNACRAGGFAQKQARVAASWKPGHSCARAHGHTHTHTVHPGHRHPEGHRDRVGAPHPEPGEVPAHLESDLI